MIAGGCDGVDDREGVLVENDVAGFDEVVGVDVEKLGPFSVTGDADEHALDGTRVELAGSGGFLDVNKGEAAKNSSVGEGWMLGEDGKVG